MPSQPPPSRERSWQAPHRASPGPYMPRCTRPSGAPWCSRGAAIALAAGESPRRDADDEFAREAGPAREVRGRGHPVQDRTGPLVAPVGGKEDTRTIGHFFGIVTERPVQKQVDGVAPLEQSGGDGKGLPLGALPGEAGSYDGDAPSRIAAGGIGRNRHRSALSGMASLRRGTASAVPLRFDTHDALHAARGAETGTP